MPRPCGRGGWRRWIQNPRRRLRLAHAPPPPAPPSAENAGRRGIPDEAVVARPVR